MNFAMNATLCATLLTVFPVFLLISVVEARAIALPFRKTNFYTWPVGIGAVFAVVGTIAMALGVQSNGIFGLPALGAWALFIINVICVSVLTVLLARTFDGEDGRGGTKGGQVDKSEPFVGRR